MLFKKTRENYSFYVSTSKQGIAIQAAVAHSIELRIDTKWLGMYMYIITEGKVCTCMKTHCNVLLACVLFTEIMLAGFTYHTCQYGLM